MLSARLQDVVGVEAGSRERDVDQGPRRRISMDPPEPFDDFAQLRLLPPVQAFKNFARSSPRFRASWRILPAASAPRTRVAATRRCSNRASSFPDPSRTVPETAITDRSPSTPLLLGGLPGFISV